MTEEKNTTVDTEKVDTAVSTAPAATDDKAAEVKTDAPVEKKDTPAPAANDGKPSFAPRGDRKGGFKGRPGQKRNSRRKNFTREKPEFEQKIVSLRRVTRVTGGGRRFSFSAAVVIGDKKGRVGFGLSKANDTSAAIDKAVRIAKRDMITLKLTENNSIPHDVQTKYKASEVLLRPVTGKGLAAGGGVRTVLELAGVNEVGGKLLSRSKNNINNARATIEALRHFAVKK